MTAVLGGGISGLAASYYLLRSAKQKVTIIEGSNAVGGWMKSVKLPNTDIVFEKGPRTIRPQGLQGLNTLLLVEELGLSDKLVPIPQNHPVAKNRLLYIKNKLHKLPNSISSFFRITPPFSRPLILAVCKDLLTSKKDVSDESIYDFVKRRFGEDLAEFIIRPMICGICAGDAKEISVKFLMRFAFDAEQKYGSVAKGLLRELLKKENIPEDLIQSNLCKKSRNESWSVWYLKGGLQLLPDALKDYLQEKQVELILNSECTEVTFVDNKVMCKYANNEAVYEHVISALPAHKLAPLLSRQHPFLSENLSAIPTVDVAVVNLAFKGNLNKENNAFGFLTSPAAELPVLGVIFDSDCFNYKDWTVLTVMMGGKWFHKHFDSTVTDEHLLKTALENVGKVLNIMDKPVYHHVSVLKKCIPQYVVGHYERVDKIFQYIKNENLPLSLVGASYNGVGINDVLMSSKVAVSQMKV